MVQFAVHPGRTALVIIDMQSCFVADSPVAAPLGAQVAGRLNRLATACRQAGIPVIWTRHVVQPNGVNTVGYKLAPLEYCYTQLGADRLLFGTDHPFAAPALPGQLIDRLPGTSAEREQILAGNAQRLLRLHAAALDTPGAAP